MLRCMRALLVVVLLSSAAYAEKSPSPYVTVERGKLRGARCPDASPCVIEYDFTYMVFANSWTKHYMADYGTPDAPLRKGAKDQAEVNARAKQAILDVLTAKKVKRASIDCTVASRLPELAGIGETVEVTLPPPGTAKPLAPVTAEQVNAMWTKAYAPVGGDQRQASPLFDDALRASMTREGTFATPTLTFASTYVSRQSCQGGKCTTNMVTQAAVYALYSPESKNVYAVDASLVVPEKEFENRDARAQKAALAALSATSSSLGAKTVAVARRSMCGGGVLPRGGWFTWKR